MCRNTSPSRITVLFLGTHTRTRFRLLYGVCTGTSQASKINPSAGYNMWCSVTRTLATIALQSRGFGCCTPKTTSFPRHHLRDPPPSQVRLPPVIRPCPPAKRTYCSRVLSLHTFRRALRCNCRCSGPQPCTGSTSSSDPPLSRLHHLNWRCRCLPYLFHEPFHPSHRNHCLLCRRAQASLTSLSTC